MGTTRSLGIVLPTALLLALAVLLLSPKTSAASNGITVHGAVLVAEITPGETYNHKITISLGINELPNEATIEVLGNEQAPDGTCLGSDNIADRPISACKYISLDKNTVRLTPGYSQEIIASVRIPLDINICGLYAVIHIQTKPTGEGTIGVISAINIPVYLTVKNIPVVHQGEIISISTTEIFSGRPIDIVTVFQNTGNHHFKFSNEVTIRDINGNLVGTMFSNLTQTSVIPEMFRDSRIIFIPEKELLPGVYFIHSKIIAEDGLVYDESDASFEVTAPFLPPASPATITVLPAEPANLQTLDGNISIAFPKGAVTETAEITLRDYPAAQLPPLPPGYQPTSICFRLDGISGLLLEEAAVTVKFTDTDVAKAGYNTSRLKLAYWDELSKEWIILQSSVNTSEMTVTADTNHFSVWTVMISPQKQTNWTVIVIILVISVLVVLGGLLFFTKRKR